VDEEVIVREREEEKKKENEGLFEVRSLETHFW
jgi:hypothetical protein